MKYRLPLFILVLISIFSACTEDKTQTPPNIVLIMCDDMGFSDLGCYGSEINTPNIDKLGYEGIRFSQFKNTGRCCPSRATLLSGRYAHSVGMGWMTAVDEHREAYRGQLSDKVPTIAEVLKENGYNTYLSGKWHVTVDGNYHRQKNPKPNGSWPRDRGFEQSYGALSGGGGYYKVGSLYRNETKIDSFPKDYYYTHAITENAVSFINNHNTENPLFLYLAHYAPHRPLQAPKERVDLCRNRYKEGYEVLRKARFERLKELGFVAKDKALPSIEKEYANGYPAWTGLKKKEQDKWIIEMATFAAMVEIVDDGIGEVVDALKAKGMYDNSLIVFLSDNGATMEGGTISQLAADVSNTPYRSYKKYSHFGGISSPLIVHYPPKFAAQAGTIRNEWAHIMDIMPTCLDVADAHYPTAFKGKKINRMDGESLLPMLEGSKLPQRDLFFEHSGNRAIISEGWKLVQKNTSDQWELIDLNTDPYEENNVFAAHPEKAKELAQKWGKWADKNQVLPLVNKPWTERIKHYTKLNPDQDGID